METTITGIILGNGFDLDLGWKTSYNDFFQAKKQYFDNLNKMSFIKDMIEGECWYDLEGYIRRITINEVTIEEKVEELAFFGRLITTKIEEYLREDSIYVNNFKSCAFELLSNITNKSDIVSFNYTDPFNICNLPPKKIEYIHNSIESTYSNKGEIILGIDKGVLKENVYLKESEISFILKSKENQIGDSLISKWVKYDNIVIFGHSLAITDSDYFKPLFDSILSNNCRIRTLYIVTKDERSLESIKDNLLSYSIRYESLLCSLDIIPIFTAKGKNQQSFREMLQIL